MKIAPTTLCSLAFAAATATSAAAQQEVFRPQDTSYELSGPFSPSSATSTVSATSVPLAMERVTRNDGIAELSLGSVYATGEFGTGSDTTLWSTAIGARVRTGGLALSASLPWMRIRSRSTIFTGVDATPVLIAPNTLPDKRTIDGFGDLTVGASYMVAPTGLPVEMALSGRAKLNTAGNNSPLSSGENDFALGADFSVPTGRISPFASVSYRFLGDTARYALRNGPAASLGVSYAIGSRAFVLTSYHYSRAATRLVEDAHEMFAGVSTPIARSRLRLTGFATAGLSRGAASVSTGVSLSMNIGKGR